jgi:hypothetical protein
MQAFGGVMSITGERGDRRFAVAECGDSPGPIAGLRARKVVA